MPISQFTIYTSEDIYGPGPINGLTGFLVSILNACLINGYGSGSSYYKPAAGWSKPCPDSGSGVGLYPYVYAGFRQASGSRFSLFVNDNYPANITFGESWITGWQYLSLSAPLSGSNSGSVVGQGIGQFPLPAQLQTYGALNVRKSATNTSVARSWILAADPYNVYMWIYTADTAGLCFDWGFGDFYSLAGTADRGRCLIYGRWAGGGVGFSVTDCISSEPARTGVSWTLDSMGQEFYGHYIANSVSGFGGSIWANKKGNFSVTSNGGSVATNYGYQIQDGIYTYPNPYDGSMRLSPLWIGDPQSISLRGKYRGLYQPLHYASSFQNGQIISGSGDLAGRVFMMIQQGRSGGHWALEISSTVEAN